MKQFKIHDWESALEGRLIDRKPRSGIHFSVVARRLFGQKPFGQAVTL
jgi:hypothetical protein